MIVRQLVEREAVADRSRRKVDSVWSIAGIAEERAELTAGTPVSERVDLYLAEALVPVFSFDRDIAQMPGLVRVPRAAR